MPQLLSPVRSRRARAPGRATPRRPAAAGRRRPTATCDVDALASPAPPQEAARAAGLRYVTDADPGLRRVRRGRAFSYVDPAGKTVRDRDTLARIKALAIPPAWTGVWIALSANAHLQASGRDARGRKQYRYHAAWRQHRDATKYTRLIAFADALPRVRRRVERDLRDPGLTRTKVLAAIVQLLQKTLIRVGNEEYARTNGSFGLTTLRDQHVEVSGQEVRFEFTGKSGVRHDVTLLDPRLARIVKRCQDLPGQTLFQYVNEAGERQTVGSADINDYLRQAAGAEFTAKDFRTWAGTVLAALALREFRTIRTKAESKRNVVRAIEQVSRRLGNTPAVCRKCYVHPAVLDAYLDGTLFGTVGTATGDALATGRPALSSAELAVLSLLQQRLAKAAAKPGITSPRRVNGRRHRGPRLAMTPR